MKRIFAALLLIAGLGAAAAPHAQSRPAEEVIQPGYWKYQSKAGFGLLNDSDYKCVRPQDRLKFLEPCNHHSICEYSLKDVADGHARYAGVWTDRRDGKRVRVSAEGTYSERRFELHATLKDVLPFPVNGTITATWQADVCPPGAKNV